MRIALLSLTLLAVAFAGCSDDGGDDPPSTTTTTTSTTSTSTGTGTNGPGIDPEPAEPIELTGTTTGVVDCTLLGQGQAPAMGDTQSVPAEASGRSYSISIEVGAAPLPSSVCITWDGAGASNSGTVPDGASQVGVYADGGPQGVAYTITIE